MKKGVVSASLRLAPQNKHIEYFSALMLFMCMNALSLGSCNREGISSQQIATISHAALRCPQPLSAFTTSPYLEQKSPYTQTYHI